MAADARPIFDFHQSLAVAAKMWRLAETLATNSGTRRRDRDAALAEWKGGEADIYRTIASEEDLSETNVLNNLQIEASRLADAWQTAVQLMNGVLYAEAIEEQQRYFDAKAAEKERQREQQNGAVGEFFADGGDFLSGFLFSGPSPYDYVESPADFAAPGAPWFSPPTGFLANYYRHGDRLYISYVNYVPA